LSFIITGLGRIGTTTLAKWLATNKDGITVKHEPDTQIQLTADAVNKRIRPNYGEVNSYLRFVLPDIDCDQKAVIIRHPYRILLSAVNRNKLIKFHDWAHHINNGLMVLDKYIESGVRCIRFELLTYKMDHHRRSVAEWLGIDSTKLPIFPHENPTSTYEHKRIRGSAVGMLHWFADKYYAERCNHTADLSALEEL
jgi:hypothetical protein